MKLIKASIYMFRNYAPGLHFAADNISLSSLKFFMVSSGNFVYFGEQGVSAVQGHPRSINLVPIESAYVTSY